MKNIEQKIEDLIKMYKKIQPKIPPYANVYNSGKEFNNASLRVL